MNIKNHNDKVKIELDSNESIVLFEFITRFTDSNISENFYESRAEEIVLLRLEGGLEKQIDSLFNPNYKSILKKARNNLLDY